MDFAQSLHYARPDISRFCLGVAPSREDAEDLAQATLIRGWVKRQLYNPARSSVVTWLKCIASRLSIDANRRRLARPTTCSMESRVACESEYADPTALFEFDAVLDAIETRDLGAIILQHLTAEQQAVFKMVLSGQSLASIAIDMDVSITAVRSRLYRSVAKNSAATTGGRPAPATDPPRRPPYLDSHRSNSAHPPFSQIPNPHHAII